MWIFAKDIGFLSIVQDENDANQLCVRARNRDHLVKAFPDAEHYDLKIVETPEGDYRWRVSVDRDVVMQLLMEKVEELDYTTNVKGTISAGDKELGHAMMTCWFAMCRYQDGTMLEDDDWDDDPEDDGPVVATVAAKRASDLATAMSGAVTSITDDFEDE
jgi:hypothetical protein